MGQGRSGSRGRSVKVGLSKGRGPGRWLLDSCSPTCRHSTVHGRPSSLVGDANRARGREPSRTSPCPMSDI